MSLPPIPSSGSWIDDFWILPTPKIPAEILGLAGGQKIGVVKEIMGRCPDERIPPSHIKSLSNLRLDQPLLFSMAFVHLFTQDKPLPACCLWKEFGSGDRWTNSLLPGLKKHVGTTLLSDHQRVLLIDVLSEALTQAKKQIDTASKYTGPHRLVGAVIEDAALDLSKPLLSMIQQHDLLLDFPAPVIVTWLQYIRTPPMFAEHAHWIDVSIKRARLMDKVKDKENSSHIGKTEDPKM